MTLCSKPLKENTNLSMPTRVLNTSYLLHCYRSACFSISKTVGNFSLVPQSLLRVLLPESYATTIFFSQGSMQILMNISYMFVATTSFIELCTVTELKKVFS